MIPRDNTMSGPTVLRPSDRSGAAGAGTLGVALFVLSLTVLFAAGIVGHVVTRVRAETWPPAAMAPLPAGLWWSTLVILASSATLQAALISVRRGRADGLRRGLAATLALGLVFLAMQVLNWRHLTSSDMTVTSNLYWFNFYLLTALHVAHVIGGLVPLAVTGVRARRGRYSWASHAGVRHCAIYWHFLGGVWVVLFAVLSLTA